MKKDLTKIIIVRHGESLANAAGIYLGHTDWDLSELGKEQARVVADYLAEEKLDAIYSSDLIRAYNTALPHAQMRGMEIIRSRQLREIYLGDWEGRLVKELECDYPEEFVIGWRQGFGTCVPPNGEAVMDVGARIYDELVRIGTLHRGGTVLVACHAAAIRALWAIVTGTPPCEVAEKIPFPKNASCTTVIFDGEVLVPVSYGDAHYFENE